MSKPQMAAKEIQNLIIANFERMVAFEQAAFNTTSGQLKLYFQERADESENNIGDLNALLKSMNECSFQVDENSQNLLGTTHLFTGQKNTTTVLKHVQYLEKSVLGWYKKGINNLKGISQATTQILSKHYSDLQTSHVYVQNC